MMTTAESASLGLPLAAALFGAAIAWVVSANARAIGTALHLLDYPDSNGGRKRHAEVTPLVGGIAVAAAAVGSALLALLLTGAVPALHLAWLALAVGVMFTIGAADDRFHLSPVLRLAVAVAVLLLVLVRAPDFGLTFLRFAGQDRIWMLGDWGGAFSLLCLVGLLNAVNMADGKNGLVSGMGLIWTAVLACHVAPIMLPVLAATGAALAVTWQYNMAGRLFLGDGGSYAMSALFGLLAIHAYNHDFEAMRADDVAVLFAIPVFDTIRLMTVRLARGRSPFEGDRDHLHHHLHARLGWPRGLWVYLAMVALPNAGALLMPGTGLVWLVAAFVAYALVMATTRLPTAQPAE
jgi:UDP-GlcNAc:undecaprenyl-phosphate/decaprenyl-phosphate GlcNAc-1-phosphate transferase